MKLKILFILMVFTLALTGCSKITTSKNTEPANQLKDLTIPQTQTEPQTETQNNLNQSETADWPTYQNIRYQYSINYPTGWFVDTTYSEDDFTQRGPVEDNEYIGGDTSWSNYQNTRQYNPGTVPADLKAVNLLIYKVQASSTLDEFISAKRYDYKNINQTSINGLVAMELSGSDNPENYGDAVPRVIMIKSQDKVFVFSPAYGAKESGEFMNQMVKTFKLPS